MLRIKAVEIIQFTIDFGVHPKVRFRIFKTNQSFFIYFLKTSPRKKFQVIRRSDGFTECPPSNQVKNCTA